MTVAAWVTILGASCGPQVRDLGAGPTDNALCRPASPRRLSAGGGVTCALIGLPRCWGDVRNLAEGDASAARPIVIAGPPGIVSIDVSPELLCAVDSSCGLSCAGRPHRALPRRTELGPVEGLSRARQLSTGDSVACAEGLEGRWFSWGEGQVWPIASGQVREGLRLARPPSLARPREIGLEADLLDCRSGCVVHAGSVACNAVLPSAPDRPLTRVPFAAHVVSVTGSARSVCALSDAREVWCWEQARVSEGSPTVAVRVAVDCAMSLAVGAGFACALLCDGSAACWGSNAHGELGRGDTRDDPTPRRVGSLTGVEEIVAGDHHACARNSEGVWCWGSRLSGRLGDGVAAGPTLPRAIPTLHDASELRLSPHGICDVGGNAVRCAGVSADEIVDAFSAAHADGDLFDEGYCASSATDTRCGLIGGPASALAIGVSSLRVSYDGTWACGIATDGTLRCARRAGVRENWTAPTVVAQGAASVRLGERHGCVVKRDSSVTCFHRDAEATCDRDRWIDDPWCRPGAPEAMIDTSTVGAVDEIAVGLTHACARRPDGVVVCWGVSAAGQIPGRGGPAGPTEVSLPRRARSLACDGRSCCAVLEDGSVQCWGDRSDLRLGSDVAGQGPTAVPGVERAERIWGGPNGYCVTRRGGETTCWGAAGAADRWLRATPDLVRGLADRAGE